MSARCGRRGSSRRLTSRSARAWSMRAFTPRHAARVRDPGQVQPPAGVRRGLREVRGSVIEHHSHAFFHFGELRVEHCVEGVQRAEVGRVAASIRAQPSQLADVASRNILSEGPPDHRQVVADFNEVHDVAGHKVRVPVRPHRVLRLPPQPLLADAPKRQPFARRSELVGAQRNKPARRPPNRAETVAEVTRAFSIGHPPQQQHGHRERAVAVHVVVRGGSEQEQAARW